MMYEVKSLYSGHSRKTESAFHCWAEFLTVCWSQKIPHIHPILPQNPRSSQLGGKRHSPTERQRDEFIDLQRFFLAL